MSNTFTKFIDSCVGAIARKVQDEFDESKHPRDKGGKFSSKGGEGRGAGTSEYDGMDRDEMEQLRSEAMRKQEREKAGSDKFHEYQKQISELTKHINRAKKSEEDDDGDAHSAVELGSPEHKNIRQSYMSALTGSVPSLDSTVRVKWALDQVDNVIRRFGTESAKNRLMGIVYNVVGLKNSGDKGHVYKQLSDYIKEFEGDPLPDTDFEKEAKKELGSGKESGSDSADGDDADAVPSLEQYKKNVSENFDGDEEYEVEARYDRAKFHSDKFKKLKNGEYRGTPEEKYLKNYYRRLGMKKPEDAFKVWWDI